jgi:hypothetical protein
MDPFTVEISMKLIFFFIIEYLQLFEIKTFMLETFINHQSGDEELIDLPKYFPII